jgi:hypothetical protein
LAREHMSPKNNIAGIVGHMYILYWCFTSFTTLCVKFLCLRSDI